MSTQDQSICLWVAAVTGAVFIVAFCLFPGFLPPMSPSMPAHEVAAFYAENTAMIRLSMILYNLFGIMLIPFFMVIVVQMKRMGSDVLAYTYLSAAASGATLFALADLFWLMAAFRPDRGADLIVLLNDMAWITFIAPVGMIVCQNVSLALAIYLDARPDRLFPAWVGHFNLVTALLMAPGALAVVYQTGPFAWNGVLAFWVRLVAFAVYVAVMLYVTHGVIRRQAREEGALAPQRNEVAA